MPAGRFAPSPTSDLHLGNLRTALLAWLFARDAGLGFLLRVEDLDQQRVSAAPHVARRQLADLSALGIDWDGEVVRQSERLEIYRDAAAGLDTYECFCTRREIAEASRAPHGSYRPYPGTCAHLTEAQRAERRATRVPAIRVRSGGASATITDLHAGTLTGAVDDFVLFRADGTPAYNLAVVVDDGLQGVTQVCRGADLLDSSPRQAWLADRLGFTVPRYVHVGLAVNTAGKRLAKRDGAVSLAALAELGADAGDVVAELCASAGLPRVRSAGEVLDRVRGTPWWQSEAIWRPWVVDPARPPR
ncbi:tRNA glutamyl-Q(34) synthetase GluQRS [Brooklawnia cerclae]|uniref:Glutamyl-Q tRNA(Asp) synthetase n=1 Tax=Brooklawnia cerclae TaxID=349934 RepID=A0ABX0SDQ3_9ACTN|nr:tRNA glutamyl-Q(34) synthetase GluQRS [Brooklawnia cerclae]NIH56140.1 glutamyl-tRNA synthetase [Brooklawnia cerclae]